MTLKEFHDYRTRVMANKTFTVYVGDGEVNDALLTIEEARKLAKSYRNKGYDDVKILDTKTAQVEDV